MTQSDQNSYEIDELDQEMLDESLPPNNRRAIRYQRSDIKALLTIKNFVVFSQALPVQLFDISSKGAGIVSTKPLKQNEKVVLQLEFVDGHSFVITARVAVVDNGLHKYGIKFDHYNDELGEQLLKTQTDLKFG